MGSGFRYVQVAGAIHRQSALRDDSRKGQLQLHADGRPIIAGLSPNTRDRSDSPDDPIRSHFSDAAADIVSDE